MSRSEKINNKINNIVSTNAFNDRFTSLTRSIKIFLPSKESNRKDEVENNNFDDFVGRERLMERLYNWLSDKNKDSGSYLVTGFRGMGKTSLVTRVTDRLTREIKQKSERYYFILLLLPLLCLGIIYSIDIVNTLQGYVYVIFFMSLFLPLGCLGYCNKYNKKRYKYPNRDKFEEEHVSKMARGKDDDKSEKKYSNIKVSINLGHEVLNERDVLSMIATSVRNKYKVFVKSIQPHFFHNMIIVLIVGIFGAGGALWVEKEVVNVAGFKKYSDNIEVYREKAVDCNADGEFLEIEGNHGESWFPRLMYNIGHAFHETYRNNPFSRMLFKFLMYGSFVALFWWLGSFLNLLIPRRSTPRKVLRRLDTLVERIVATTEEVSGATSVAEKNVLSVSFFNRQRHKIRPIADIREIETELAEIINQINSDGCPNNYRAHFIVVFDEMDKIDPAIMEQHNVNEMPEFTDSVKGFPDGMDSRERRRNVLKLLANIKLFVSTAKAKFIFISGRELYDAYLADLSDRDFAISSIFSGVINVDSFLTPEGGQTDVRSMSEWYIANQLIPFTWLKEKEIMNAEGRMKGQSEMNKEKAVLKQERPSLRWYYEYLVDECKNDPQEATYVIGFLHIFAAYLTHISNGSPKKIFLYFDKYIRLAKDCLPMNDWKDECIVGQEIRSDKRQRVLFFEPIQQKTINFVYYLSNPIMGTITNDMSNYGDRFLVSLSFIIDHIYKYHSRSFSWRNLEQIPDLLKTSKAPELRDEMTSIMEYLTQVHISPILIGLNEYKFHKSIAEEISVMSRMSDEASAIFNFTLDESLSVIQYNTRLLNYYKKLDKESSQDNNTQKEQKYMPLIARIHSNLGDLHFWDEDYYSATLEYRAAIETLPDSNEDESGFLTRVRCMLKLGLAYELRKLYPNAYQTYCRLINLLISKRWVHEEEFGLSVMDARIKGWQEKRQVMIYPPTPEYSWYEDANFAHQFKHPLFEGNYNLPENTSFSANFDGIISTFARDLTVQKSQTINTLTLFEEIRYLYQSILAKLSILEKMGMSGITQTNIDVAEGEFRTIHKSVNFREKFIIAADFFRKLAEILYYKNNLTILTQNQDAFYVSAYYFDQDLMANLDDFCTQRSDNAHTSKHDIRYFFYILNNSASDKIPKVDYSSLGNRCTLDRLYQYLDDNVDFFLNDDKTLQAENRKIDRERVAKNVKRYLKYNIENVIPNSRKVLYFRSVEACDNHSKLLRQCGLRTPCYACKYYVRSLRILADNMFVDKDVLDNTITKSMGIIKHSFKNKLLYTNSSNIRALAQTLEGFGNVMFSCASGNNREGKKHYSPNGISRSVIKLLQELSFKDTEKEELETIIEGEKELMKCLPLSRLDKSILYYWDAYRFYLMDACYNDAVGCLNKILNLLVYYIEVLCYYEDGSNLQWGDEKDTVVALIGDKEFNDSFIATLFHLIVRYTSYKYDLTNLSEINELKWIYSKEIRHNIDLTRLSLFPAVRSAWLRAIEIRAKGLRFLVKQGFMGYEQDDYLKFIKLTYPLITPQRRYETTFYEEVMGYYTKMRYNDHIMNILFGGNPLIDKKARDYSDKYHIVFYEKLYDFLDSRVFSVKKDYQFFDIDIEHDVNKRLDLIEFLIHDSLVCITNMVNVFTPHNHLTSYSKSFVGVVYNFFWEWSRKYEFLYTLYQYHELIKKGCKKEAEKIVGNIWGSSSVQSAGAGEGLRRRLGQAMSKCSDWITQNETETEKESRYGSRSDRLYERLRHDIDDITINTIFSNYAAEMALKYYQKAVEANTEGESYREMIGAMHFLNDDLNNDTCQFNIACDRFLLNCGVVAEQHRRLEKLYKNSNVYSLRKAYIEGPDKLSRETIAQNQFDRSQFINSEY
ncbi:MAG: ATP-binding protein [Paludibacteraceae bacterium]|nr:ATP-binding protein [Paludibacteraceae bacterium]MBP5664535.1 ATP-binding protein [Bacteroidales bacterium]